jgi:hypothetical protein
VTQLLRRSDHRTAVPVSSVLEIEEFDSIELARRGYAVTGLDLSSGIGSITEKKVIATKTPSESGNFGQKHLGALVSWWPNMSPQALFAS